MASPALAGDTFYLDPFAIRQWDDPQYQGTRLHHDRADFVKRIHEFYKQGTQLVDGYAPFCKHLFVPNFAGAKVGCMKITDDIRPLIETAYESRRPEELAVLSRWVPASKVKVLEAKMLDIILYSREQILEERKAMPEKGSTVIVPDVSWGIISIKAQDEDHETPMQPITMMRNALGRDEGGSGVKLDRAKYEESVCYWQARVPILDR